MSDKQTVMNSVRSSRWYDPSWMTLTSKEGYFSIGVFSVRLGPVFDDFAFYHDLAHAMWAVHKNESWRLDAFSFGLNYTTKVTVFGVDYYEPVTQQGLEHEVETVALQCHLTRMAKGMGHKEVEELMYDGISSLVYMTDFILFISDMEREGLVESTAGKENERIAIDALMVKCRKIYDTMDDDDVEKMWHRMNTAALELKNMEMMNSEPV